MARSSLWQVTWSVGRGVPLSFAVELAAALTLR